MATVRARIQLNNAVVLSVAIGMTSPLVARVTRRVLNRGEVLSPVDFGVLRGSHSMSMRVTRTSVTGRVEVGARYAHFVHDGTAPHTIQAKHAKALAFNWKAKGGIRVVVPKGGGKGRTGIRKGKKGAYLFVAKGFVRHPGTKARPWLHRALVEEATPAGFTVTVT